MLIADFNSKYLTPLLEKQNREDKFCFLMGDFNINLLKLRVNMTVRNSLIRYVHIFYATCSATYKGY